MSIKIHDNSLKSLRTYFNDKLDGLYDDEELSSLFFIALEHYLQITRLQYFKDPAAKVSESDILRMRYVAKELRSEKPIQYIIGSCYFLDLKIKVNEHVLIPRSETEEMVDDIFKRGIKAKRIIDICTGSGCIALALKKHFPDSEVMALDISHNALEIAEENAKLNNLKIDFEHEDILNVEKDLGMFDLIVSNPPYVMEMEKQEMKSNVLNYEPALALFVSDEDALIFYRSIISYAVEKLDKGGWLFMEINEKFGKEIKEMMKAAGINKNLEKNVDLNSKDRWLSGQKSE